MFVPFGMWRWRYHIHWNKDSVMLAYVALGLSLLNRITSVKTSTVDCTNRTSNWCIVHVWIIYLVAFCGTELFPIFLRHNTS